MEAKDVAKAQGDVGNGIFKPTVGRPPARMAGVNEVNGNEALVAKVRGDE